MGASYLSEAEPKIVKPDGDKAVAALGKETMSRPGESRDDMLMYAARSFSETRGGDIFAFPQKYSFIAGNLTHAASASLEKIWRPGLLDDET